MPHILLRQADIEDIPVLAVHHRWMFEEIWAARNRVPETSRLAEMEKQYIRKLEAHLKTDICRAWVVQCNGEIVASGAVSVLTTVPVPDDPSNDIAYLHSMYTVSTSRHQGFARKIIETALDYCRLRGIHRIILNASAAGRPLYEKLGFEIADNAMRMMM